MKIKICGITNLQDAQDAVFLGADAVGFIFHKPSPRYVPVQVAEEICMDMPPFVSLVGVFVDQSAEEIDEIVTRCKLDIVQLHGNESPGFCMQMKRRVIKVFRVQDLSDLSPIPQYQGMVSAICLDTKVRDKEGGTGQTFDWGVAIKAKEFDMPLILSGGITAQNINKAAQLVNPFSIDLASGVEVSPGKKDYNKMQEIIQLAHRM